MNTWQKLSLVFRTLKTLSPLILVQLGLGLAGAAGVLSAGLGGWQWWRSQPQQCGLVAESSGDQLDATVSAQLAIYVAGQVQKPGVYQLPSGARVGEALTAAGGVTELADSAYVAQTLNLAEVLKDGQHLVIPTAKKKIPVSNQQVDDDTASDLSSSLISINMATVEELDQLPSIGPKRAQDIIDQRPYSSLEDLVNKKVVTETIFGEIRGSISL